MEEAAEKDSRACGGPETKDVPDHSRAGGYAQTKGDIYETKGIPETRAGGYAETKGIPETTRAGGYAQTKGILNTAGGDTETREGPNNRGGTETQTKGVSG